MPLKRLRIYTRRYIPDLNGLISRPKRYEFRIG